MAGTLYITGDPEADGLLNTDPLALLIGMLLDQQVPMEWAFRGPASLKERLGGRLDARAIAAMTEEQVIAVFVQKPALHRYPANMARRTHELCGVIVDQYDGNPAAVWEGAATGEELFERLHALPGFGEEKARIFVAILGKRMGVTPPGWQKAATPFADREPRSVADIDSPASLEQVRRWKKAMKAAKLDKQGRALH